ncbi:Short-chain dehydrogenase/reductase family protein [Mycena indigotica]|uniref:Short-chain dehydrogenase/reductase family protein n=1 Tax=Mycena indigotica TaxID=2126181 RepID=A0A8H6T191_9AGAR|nr:Short-chain dehydrogenase/reductase family protein [Mycena indigotica]KAF7310145.1 Short-chain dehydrogenase/reductase family protein [Mycena indigotica]
MAWLHKSYLLPLWTSARVRVYALRSLLLTLLMYIVMMMHTSTVVRLEATPQDLLLDIWAHGSCIIAFFHHIFIITQWAPKTKRAIQVELVLLLLELSGVATTLWIIDRTPIWSVQFGTVTLNMTPLSMAIGAIILSLLVLQFLFRSIILWKGKDYSFLAGCLPVSPPYSPRSMLLNRSLSRPLVRGESAIIIILRALIISFCAVIVPGFAIYSIIIKPSQTQIHLTTPIGTSVSVPEGGWDQTGVAFSIKPDVEAAYPQHAILQPSQVEITAVKHDKSIMPCTIENPILPVICVSI